MSGAAVTYRERLVNVPQSCLKCEETLLCRGESMECPACGARWPLIEGIPSYGSADYSGAVTREAMRGLIALAENGHWLTAVRAVFKESNPQLYDYAADLSRASWIPILPIGPESTVLEISSGLGAVTHALALNYRRVVSVESVAELARFGKVRLDQEGLNNVDLIQTTLELLPFCKETFDLIVLNGVLEWVGEWRGRIGIARDAQSEALRDLRRLLRPEGVLIVGSENRIAYTSWLHRRDHPRVQVGSIRLPWLDSVYAKLKRPGFYRSLLDPRAGYRRHSRSPHGYSKLLQGAGFSVVDVWWPPNGYNSPHTLLRASDRAAIRLYCDYERRYRDRLYGHGVARQLRHCAVVGTRLIHLMLPDVIMIARPTARAVEHAETGDLVSAALEKHAPSGSERSRKNAGADGRYYASSLTTHPYRNKTVVKVSSGASEDHAVMKVANVKLPGAEVVQRSYEKLQRLYSSIAGNGTFLADSIPSPMGVASVGPLLATVESLVCGARLHDLSLERKYFDDRDRVRRHLELITSWLVASRPALDALGSDRLFEVLPSGWFLEPDGGIGAEGGSVLKLVGGIQHGDFHPGNVFIDEEAQRVWVIDWDSCGSGYPPLFDWFCLVTGLYYTEKIDGLPSGQTVEFMSFRQTYFGKSWFSELILALSQRLCDSLGLDAAKLRDYFRLYVIVRLRQLLSHPESEEKYYRGPLNSHLYKQFYEFLVKHKEECCFGRVSRP